MQNLRRKILVLISPTAALVSVGRGIDMAPPVLVNSFARHVDFFTTDISVRVLETMTWYDGSRRTTGDLLESAVLGVCLVVASGYIVRVEALKSLGHKISVKFQRNGWPPDGV